MAHFILPLSILCSFMINITVKGCMFHFGQCLLKRFNSLGLKQLYESNEMINYWFRKIFLLALIPEDDLHETIDFDLDREITKKCNSFLNYEKKSFMPPEAKIFPQQCGIILKQKDYI